MYVKTSTIFLSRTVDLPDIPPPMSRADRLIRRQMMKDHINWQQTQDMQATTTEAEDQSKLKIEPIPDSKKKVNKDVDLEDENVPVPAATVTVSTSSETEPRSVDSTMHSTQCEPRTAVLDYRRLKLYGYMEQMNKMIRNISVLSQKTHFISDGEVYSSENKRLAMELVAAGKLLQEEGKNLVKIGNDFSDMCRQIEEQQQAQIDERNRRAAARKSDDSTDEETVPALVEAKPQPNCHNVEATGQYLVGKQTGKEFKHKCTVCMRTFQKAETLEGHKLIHTKDSLTCNTCKLTCTSHEYLRLHMVGHAVGGFTCGECGAHFGVKTSYLNHVKLHLGLSFNCEHCEKKYKSKAALSVHMKKEHLPREGAEERDGDDEAEQEDEPTKKKRKVSSKKAGNGVTCGVCPKLTFKNVYSLRTHSSRWHPNKPKKTKVSCLPLAHDLNATANQKTNIHNTCK